MNKIKRIGYTKHHLLKRIIREFIEKCLLKFYSPYRYKFSDGIVKDGVDELSIAKSNGESESIWIVKY